MSDSKSALKDKISKVVQGIPRSGIRDFFDIVSARSDVISLGIGEPDFDTPWHIREAAIFAIEKGATSYTSNLGMLKLRKSLAKYVSRHYNVDYCPENEIVVTVGVSEALDIAVRAITNPGDEIIYHEPAFVSYGPIIRLAGGVPVVINTRIEDQFKLTRAQLEANITPRTKALLINFPNNPTGATMTSRELQDIADVAKAHDLIVIADEIYAELSYERAHTTITSLPGMRERTIFMHGFSKTWAMTGLRLGYACAPAPLVAAMMKIHQYTVMCAPTPSQEAAVEALERGLDDAEQMRSEYRRRRNFIYHSFNEIGLHCFKPEGSFYIFPDITPFGLSSHEFAVRLLDEESVAVVPGTAFGACGEGFIRCSYSTSMNDLKIAVERIARFIKNLQTA